ncbi:MAG: hypothetical protein JXR53_03280 [Bacteroidales bacterium]|nr:hypothetical protein [Bacteroidales bacterium]
MKQRLFVLLIILSACTSKEKTNYEVLKEYFEATVNGDVIFYNPCIYTTNKDEGYELSYYQPGNTFFFSFESANEKLELKFTPDTIYVLKDFGQTHSIVSKHNFKVETSKAILNSFAVEEYHNRTDIDSPDFQKFLNQRSFLFFELDDDNLIMHIDYLMKIRGNKKYYFNKEVGLYRIVEWEYSRGCIDRKCERERILE